MKKALICLSFIAALAACEAEQDDAEQLNDIPEAVEGIAI